MITGTTKLLALFGSPVSHSGSPVMYNSAFKALGLDYVYVAIDIGNNIKEAISAARLFNMKGFNLTMPCKSEALHYVDEVSKEAEIVGAINTVVNENGKLKGYITDGIGFVNNLLNKGITVKNKKIVVLGAGGAATAIILQLAIACASEIVVLNRRGKTFDKFSEKIKEMTKLSDTAISITDIKNTEIIKGTDILVNATPIGMGTDETPVNSDLLKKDLVIADIVYNPVETRLLKEAKNRGCICINGKGMLLYQGIEAFRLFTGQNMPKEVIKA